MKDNTTPKRQTNVEMVNEFMECGSPMNQVFLIEAVSFYSKHVKEQAMEIRENMKGSFINPDAWIMCAHDWTDMVHKQTVTRPL